MRCTVLHLSRLGYASAESEAETPTYLRLSLQFASFIICT
jgi:hypothetical protein